MRRGGIAKEGTNRVARWWLLAAIALALIALLALPAAAVPDPRIAAPLDSTTVAGTVAVNVIRTSGFNTAASCSVQYAPDPYSSWTQIGAVIGGPPGGTGAFNVTRNWVTTGLTDGDGSYRLRVIWSNSWGVSHTITVTVDNTAPTAVCNDITVELDAAGSYTLTSADIVTIAAGSSDAIGIDSMTVSPGSTEMCL